MARIPQQRPSKQPGINRQGSNHIAYRRMTAKNMSEAKKSSAGGCLVTAIALGAGIVSIIGGAGYAAVIGISTML